MAGCVSSHVLTGTRKYRGWNCLGIAMRTVKTAVLAVVMGLLYSASSAQEAAKTPPKDYTDHEFGFSLHTEGFTEMEAQDKYELMYANLEATGRKGGLQLDLYMNSTVDACSKAFVKRWTDMGVPEKSRTESKLGALKATLIDMEATKGNYFQRNLFAQDGTRVWMLGLNCGKSNVESCCKLFDDAAKSFKNSYKPDPKNPPAASVCCSERVGYFVDAKSFDGERRGMSEVAVVAFTLTSSDEARGIVIVTYDSLARDPVVAAKALLEVGKQSWEERGFEVKSMEQVKYAGKDAVKFVLRGELANAERNITMYTVFVPDGHFNVIGACVLSAGDDTVETVTKCVESFKFVPIKQGAAAAPAEKPAQKPAEKPAPKPKGK